MNKVLERFRKLYDEIEQLDSPSHWKDWADALAEEVAKLKTENEQWKKQNARLMEDLEGTFAENEQYRIACQHAVDHHEIYDVNKKGVIVIMRQSYGMIKRALEGE